MKKNYIPINFINASEFTPVFNLIYFSTDDGVLD